MVETLTWNTAVEFITGVAPVPGGGGTNIVQTGDVIGIVLAILFFLLAVGACATMFFMRKYSMSSVEGNSIAKAGNKMLGIFCGIMFVMSISSLIIAPAVSHAVTDEDAPDETIYAYVDKDTGTITFDQSTIANKDKKAMDVYVSSAETTLSDEASAILADKTFNLKISGIDGTIYEAAVPGQFDYKDTLSIAPGNSETLTYEITGLDTKTALELCGIQVFETTLYESECYTITYDTNEATTGTAPRNQIQPVGGEVTLATAAGFTRKGYTLESYWSTTPTGEGEHFAWEKKITTDKNLDLFATWTKNCNIDFKLGSEPGTGNIPEPTIVKKGISYKIEADGTLEFANGGKIIREYEPSPAEGFEFEKWTINDSEEAATSGEITDDTSFNLFYQKKKEEITITYKVLNTSDPHGGVCLNISKSEEPAPEVQETEISIKEQNFIGASAVDFTYTELDNYKYFFSHWTMDNNDTFYTEERTLTKDLIKEKCGDLTKDTIFIAHFVAPVAIYTEENSTMVFSCQEIIDEEAGYTFPVNNSHAPQDRSEAVILPSWYNYDGTPKVYPRTVKFMPNFKKYEGITSTSYWFCDSAQVMIVRGSTENESVFESLAAVMERQLGIIQPSVLAKVEGLDNIYTENIKETAYMFCQRSTGNTQFTSLDFSSWNIGSENNLINMTRMFAGLSYLSDLKLPDETQGHYFGTYASNLSSMFERNYEMRSFEIKGGFGSHATLAYSMFLSCRKLEKINLGGDFLANVKDLDSLFCQCSKLTEVNISGNFGNSCLLFHSMFDGCSNLRNINILEGAQFGVATQNPSSDFPVNYVSMFYNCVSLRSLNLRNFAINDSEQYDYLDNMFSSCISLKEFSIGDKWKVDMADLGLDASRARVSNLGWYKNYSTQTYSASEIPSSSGPGTFSLDSAKAIYDPNASTFTFVYDHADHSKDVQEGCTIFNVPENAGFVAGARNPMSYPSHGSLALMDVTSDIIFEISGPNVNYLMDRLKLPDWYRFNYDEYKIELLIDASKPIEVVFDPTFINFSDLLSTSCWFIADSNGNAPFTFTKTEFGYINTGNLVSVACMFGGFSFDMFKNYYDWDKDDDEIVIEYGSSSPFSPIVVKRLSQSNGIDAVANVNEQYVFVSRYLDTYNTTLTNLDLSDFEINSIDVDYSAICANCTALTTVTLPSYLCLDHEEQNMEDNAENNTPATKGDEVKASALERLIGLGIGFDPHHRVISLSEGTCSFAGAFYNCASLKNITNISTFNPFDAIEDIKTVDLKYGLCGKMFYGCKSLTSLNLANFNTYAAWIKAWNYNEDLDAMADWDLFKYCDSLSEITIGVNWWISMGSDEGAALPDDYSYDIYWTQNGRSYNSGQIPHNYEDSGPILTGKFTRNSAYLSKLVQTATFSVDNPDSGSVSIDTYKFMHYANYYTYNNALYIDDMPVFATPTSPDWEFAYWTLNGKRIADGDTSASDRAQITDGVNKNEFVAHFTRVGWSAKAVYVENDSEYDGHNTLRFYYDNLSHELEGTVYEVNSTTYANTERHNASLPSWYTTVYTATSDIWAGTQVAELPLGPGSWSGLYYGDRYMSDYIPYNDISNAMNSTYIEYSSLWRIKCLVDAKDVVFEPSFKEFDNLQSISMWFMADQFANQPFENFYSPTEANSKNVGFANLNTSSLINVQYAFGGLFEKPMQHRQVQMWLDNSASAFDLLSLGVNDLLGVDEDLWQKDTETIGTSITELDLTEFDFSNVTDMSYMFANAVALDKIKLGANFDSSSVKDMSGVFANCENLGPSITDSVDNWELFKTNNVQRMEYMFYGCSGLETLDLSQFNTEKVGRTFEAQQQAGEALAKSDESQNDIFGSRYAPTDSPYLNFEASLYQTGMFSECTRLNTVVTTSGIDKNKSYDISGWNLNFGMSGLIKGTEEYPWINVEKQKKYDDVDKMPFDYRYVMVCGGVEDPSEIVSGTFTRDPEAYSNHKATITVNDTALGTVSSNEYNYIKSVQVKLDNMNSNVIWTDNRKIVATPALETSRFLYWKLKINDTDEEFILHDGFNETYYSSDYPKDVEIIACFDGSGSNAYVVFTNHKDNDDLLAGQFTFYFGSAENPPVPEGDELIEVLPVDVNTNDYNLPSWYRKYQESWFSGDNHPIPKFIPSVEKNANYIYVNFDESFAQFKGLRSMSCWFMGALSLNDESKLYNPFILDSEDHFDGLENIDTSSLINVKYMFGGHEFFNDIHGSKNEKIYMTNFDQAGNLTNIDGLFANLPRVEEILVNDKTCFGGASAFMQKITSMQKTFYNTDALDKSTLTWLKTSSVENMSYMFARTNDNIPQEYAVQDSATIKLPASLTTEKLSNMSGMFSGYNYAKELVIDLTECTDFDTCAVTDMSYLFANSVWMEQLTLKGNVDDFVSDSAVNVSSMFENCTQITNINPSGNHEQIPVQLLNLKSALYMNSMFSGCTSLESFYIFREYIEVEDYNNAIMSSALMFADCPALETCDLSSFVFNWENYGQYKMFNNADGSYNSTLKTLKIDYKHWNPGYDTPGIYFYQMGLADRVDGFVVPWMDTSDLRVYDTTRLPVMKSKESSDNDESIKTYKRCTTICNFYTEQIPYSNKFYTKLVKQVEYVDNYLSVPDYSGNKLLEEYEFQEYSSAYLGCPDGYSMYVKWDDDTQEEFPFYMKGLVIKLVDDDDTSKTVEYVITASAEEYPGAHITWQCYLDGSSVSVTVTQEYMQIDPNEFVDFVALYRTKTGDESVNGFNRDYEQEAIAAEKAPVAGDSAQIDQNAQFEASPYLENGSLFDRFIVGNDDALNSAVALISLFNLSTPVSLLTLAINFFL